jgi:tetratricopeptide (TPR) repeat protein
MILNELVKVGQNDLCPCGSKVKFKKCCLENKSNRQDITTYEITTEPMPEFTSDENMSFIDKKTYDKIGQEISHKESINYHQAIEQLSQLKEKYPTARRIYNLLGICYQMIDENDKSQNLTIEAYQKFPNYLFARTGYVGHWMHKGDYTKFDEVFGGCYDLQQLYPERNKFHVSEAFAFFIVCGRYFAEKGNIETAKKYLKMAKELKPKDPSSSIIEKEIMLATLKPFVNFSKKRKMHDV